MMDNVKFTPLEKTIYNIKNNNINIKASSSAINEKRLTKLSNF